MASQRIADDEGKSALDAWRRLGLTRYGTLGLLERVWELRDNLSARLQLLGIIDLHVDNGMKAICLPAKEVGGGALGERLTVGVEEAPPHVDELDDVGEAIDVETFVSDGSQTDPPPDRDGLLDGRMGSRKTSVALGFCT